jgi:cysteinyl-tRNA synthetase
MSECHLGNHFDIHGGGQDLQFPHHENEIAQSEAAHDCTFVNYWMHNGFVRVDDEKMSKSLGNFFTIRDVLKKYDSEVVRFFILRAHYRSPLNYSDKHLDDAKQALTRLYTALRGFSTNANYDEQDVSAINFKAAMNDDFNTPEAVAVLFDLANELNKTRDVKVAAQLKGLASLLGLLNRDPESYLKAGNTDSDDVSKIEQLILARTEAKQAKNFVEADKIRQDLMAQGVILEDCPQGTTWRRV